MLHVEAETLREDAEPGQSELEDGTRVSAETSRRMACDCGVVRIGHGPEGQIVGGSRRKRTVSPSLRRALEARDRGCRFPGCGLRFTDAHHVKHWADGGETSLRNLVLLCRKHHRVVHEGGARVCIDANQQIVFFTPKGKALFGAPPPQPRHQPRPQPRPHSSPHPKPSSQQRPPPQQQLEPQPRQQEPPPKQEPQPPGSYPGAARWSRDSHIPWALEAQVWEALDSG